MPAASDLPSGEVLDLDDAARALVAALDDDGGGVPSVGIFELGAHAGFAEIELGGDAGIAERRDHALVVAEAGAVHDGDDHRAGASRVSILPSAVSAACSRDTPIEKPVAGTSSFMKRPTRPS